MDSRTAAHVLQTIAAYLELHGENRFKARAYASAAKGVQATGADDLAPMLRSGELAAVPGVGPATLAVLRDLVESGESRYLEQLRATTPEGLLDMLRIPGLGSAKIHQLHTALGIETVEELEQAARDGRLAKLPRWGPKTAEKVLKGIAFMRSAGRLVLLPHALAEAERLVAMVGEHPDVERAEVAGSIRRRCEVAADVDIVAACRGEPRQVAESFARGPGVRRAVGGGPGSVCIDFVDGTRLDLRCVTPDDFALALWRATGGGAHVEAVEARLEVRGLRVDGNVLRDARRHAVRVTDEQALYDAAGIAYVPPELREGTWEIAAAERRAMPTLLEPTALRGALHCHSIYSDGKATIAEMADAARRRGWSYIGITDHSVAAFYAGGLPPERVLMQHEEIDELNATLGDFRVLKGVEADILADGRLDYDEALLDRFDFVVGSVHSRFNMDGAAMTARVLAAMDDPRLTILGHPTGRLLLAREAYAIDMDAVLDKAAERGVAVELNADPHRLDVDWRLLPRARALGVTIEIGPDAHSTQGLDNVRWGVMVARKGGVEAREVLNAWPVEEVLAFAARRRTGGR